MDNYLRALGKATGRESKSLTDLAARRNVLNMSCWPECRSVDWIALTNEPPLLPVAPHSEGCEIFAGDLEVSRDSRGSSVRLFCRPSFFGEVVRW